MSARLVSVNVGTPKVVDTGRRRVSTAIWKTPVEGRVAVRGVNLDGDDQADRSVHGGPDKAVYAYAAEDTAHWERELGRELGPGAFGENLTTEGVAVSCARLGERWRVGSTLLEVRQPRLPCFKLGIRMGDAAFVDRFQAARRPGAYLRIVRPGQVAAGDAIAVVPAEPPGIRILELVADPTADLLYRITADGRVPRGWRKAAARALASP
jgi:MOSC domain-containing protein YiiM